MRQMLFNAFDMACIGHIQHGMWAHPRDRSTDYRSLDYWVDLARLLERGLFDGLFLADVLGIYDVYGQSPDASLRNAVQVPLIDPMLVIPAMAHATKHLGFGVTCNLAYEAPYLLARRMSSLDHLTKGRIGWNIVTGYLDSAARAMGFDAQMEHDDRYDLADEYMQAVYALWEGSWDDGAVDQRSRRPRLCRSRAGAQESPIAASNTRSMRFTCASRRRSARQCCTRPARPIAAREFAARHAECVFVNPSTKANVGRLVADLRARAAPRPLKVFMGVTVVVGRTEREAQDKLAEYRRYASVEGALAHAAASLGIDFAAFGMDEPIDGSDSQAIRSNVEAMARAIGPGWTKRQLIDRFVLGSRQIPITGDPDQVVDELASWVNEADVDGFNLARTVVPECLTDFIALVVPKLQERGLYKREYAPGLTYREKLFGEARLRAPHPAAEFRGGQGAT